MYEVKMDEARFEILENIKSDDENNDSIWMRFCIFMGMWTKELVNLFGILSGGLWCFIKFLYYKFMVWFDHLDRKG